MLSVVSGLTQIDSLETDNNEVEFAQEINSNCTVKDCSVPVTEISCQRCLPQLVYHAKGRTAFKCITYEDLLTMIC